MAVSLKAEPKETTIPAPAKPKVDEGERKKALEVISKFRQATAWQVHRWPLEKKTVDHKTKIHLPRSYLATAGEDVKTVWAGSDLNQIVHQHYFDALDLVSDEIPKKSANFVTPDAVTVRRHEYLGPDPRIAGYRFDADGEVHVKWWDSFLGDLWMDKGKWKWDVKMTEDGKWVEVDD
ncbi:hypothetical protein PsYK624_028010 [Phanerochaete sordida]|uniref:Uncharacterized protein n=1 Tax=Phanerochaete sordida TaxID=48140 RepID=A0A9P3G2J4_9APHY|nr:hypothetical protein PsYK624_028010 [Phanerochaete sordida]